ncbi:hypothetical protein KKH18_06970 [bacterium]|nr:hypothetical protein [bacterium]
MSVIITRAARLARLAQLRQTEAKSDVYPLIGNLPTMRLILVWPKLALDLPEAYESNEPNAARALDDLWAGIILDYPALADSARIPLSVIKQHVREAQVHRWIYPDGSIHAHALELARATILKIARGKEE